MKAHDLMTRRVCTVAPADSFERAARLMWKRDVGLLVVESGAYGTAIPALAVATDSTVVIEEGEGEFPIRALSRVNHCIAELERSGCRLGPATLVVAPEVEVRRMAARRLIARALRAASSSLVIVLDPRADLVLRHEMLAVVEELVSELECRQVPILLRFGQNRKEPSSS